MTTDTKHTPPPFTYEAVAIMKEGALYAVWGKRPGDDIFRDKIMVTVDPEKAAFIVRAVNAHDELMRTAKEFIQDVRDRQRRHVCPGFDCSTCTPSYSDLEAAIAKAEGH